MRSRRRRHATPRCGDGLRLLGRPPRRHPLPAQLTTPTSTTSQLARAEYYSFAITMIVAVGVIFELHDLHPRPRAPPRILTLREPAPRTAGSESGIAHHRRRAHSQVVDFVSMALQAVRSSRSSKASIWVSVFFERRWRRSACDRRAARGHRRDVAARRAPRRSAPDQS